MSRARILDQETWTLQTSQDVSQAVFGLFLSPNADDFQKFPALPELFPSLFPFYSRLACLPSGTVATSKRPSGIS